MKSEMLGAKAVMDAIRHEKIQLPILTPSYLKLVGSTKT